VLTKTLATVEKGRKKLRGRVDALDEDDLGFEEDPQG
jgi:hypothetical protein